MSGLKQKNKKLLLSVLGFAALMVGVSFASVPLYRVLCKATGWGGTTQVGTEKARTAYDRTITVRFNTDTASNMPWVFRPDAPSVRVRVGADGFASFSARNTSDETVTGTAVYNVTPLKAGKYFYKTQCFCFGEQILTPYQKVNMPVTFFIDPKIMDDREMDDVHTITLSYTFFRKDTPELEKAMEKFYNEATN